MFSVDLFFSSSSSDDEYEEEHAKRSLIITRKQIRQKLNPFDLPDKKFVQYFRLSKEAFRSVLTVVNSKLPDGIRASFVPPILKLAATLRILAEGGYQSGAANDLSLGLAQPTISRSFAQVIDVLETHICPQWIKFDMNDEEKHKIKLNFYLRTGLPGVIGCIDGTHVRILPPKKEEQHLYFNKKGFYSLNTMIVCDHKMCIRFIDARQPGSIHDALVWNCSYLRDVLKAKFDSGERNAWLLGDAGYPLEPFLMTPFRGTEEGSPQRKLNAVHAKGRNIVEKTIEVLRNRFRCLLGVRPLHYSPRKATQITNVCAALHNICIYYKTEVPLNADNTEFVLITETPERTASNDENEEATTIRNQIMNSL